MAILSCLLCVLMSQIFNPINYHGLSNLEEGEHKTLFIFGDSIFEANTVLPLPYGKSFFRHPSGRLCDGRIVPDFIAELAKLPMLPPYLQLNEHRFTDGANFAKAGAGVLVNTKYPDMILLSEQLSYFKTTLKSMRQKLGDVEVKKVLMRAVYLFSIGANDYVGLYLDNSNATQSYRRQFVEMVIGNCDCLGGRKIAFQNVGPLGCAPAFKEMTPQIGSECAEELTALVMLHNRALAKSLKNLENKLPGFKYSIFDFYNALGDRVNNPTKYGFKNGKAACCGSGRYRGGMRCASGTEPYELCSNPDDYVWFDGGHNTEAANRQLAMLMWSGAPNVTRPYNVKQLFEQA
ncbi:hypothetical protein SLA2020_270970 [Shorea laevis]